MPFIIEPDGKGGVKVTDLDTHDEIPCGMCVSSAFRLGYFLHGDCGEAIGKLTKQERAKIIELLDERDKKRVEQLSPDERAKICKRCGHFESQHRPLGVADWGTGCAIKMWVKDCKDGDGESRKIELTQNRRSGETAVSGHNNPKSVLADCPCEGFVSLGDDSK